MMLRKFEYKEDKDYGNMGWHPIWMKGANVVTGGGAAHDILEHHPTMPLGAECEFHALGALYWIRGESGWFHQHTMTNAEEVIARDHVSILRNVAEGTETLRKPPNTNRLSEYHFGGAEEAFNGIVSKGIRMAKADWNDYSGSEVGNMSIPHDADQRILGWLRLGYRYASQRYGMGNSCEAAHLFDQIASAVDKYKHAEEYEELRVEINLKRFRAKAYIHYPEDPDDWR